MDGAVVAETLTPQMLPALQASQEALRKETASNGGRPDSIKDGCGADLTTMEVSSAGPTNSAPAPDTGGPGGVGAGGAVSAAGACSGVRAASGDRDSSVVESVSTLAVKPVIAVLTNGVLDSVSVQPTAETPRASATSSDISAASAPAPGTGTAPGTAAAATTATATAATTATAAATTVPAVVESPSKSRRKQELVFRQAPADAEIVADTVAEAHAAAAAAAAVSSASDDVKAHRRKQMTPKRKLITASPTRLIARHKRVKLGAAAAPRGRKKLKVVTKPSPALSPARSPVLSPARPPVSAPSPAKAAVRVDDAEGRSASGPGARRTSAARQGSARAAAVARGAAADGKAKTRADVGVKSAVKATKPAVVEDEVVETGTAEATEAEGATAERGGARGPSSDAAEAAVNGPHAADTPGVSSAADSAEPSAAAGVPTSPPPARRGRPRKTSVQSAEPSGSRATVAPPAAAGRTKRRGAGGAGPGAGRRRRRRPATGFTARRPAARRRLTATRRTAAAANGHGAAPRLQRAPRKRRKVGDLSIDMKEQFTASPGKTRSRARSLTEERSSRERPVNGTAPCPTPSPTAAQTESPPAPDGVSSADWEAKWRCWVDEGSKKSWQTAEDAPTPRVPAAAPPAAPPATPRTETNGAVAARPAAVATRRRGPGRRGRGRRVPAAPAAAPSGGRRGPYLQLGGAEPLSVRVVNCAADLGAAAAPRRPPITCPLDSIPGQPRVGFSSAYAKNYDAFCPDPTWTCVFCRRRSHASRLGDLYGPCFLRRRLEAVESAARPRQRRRSQPEPAESAEAAAAGSKVPPSVGHEFETSRFGDRLESWFHESCLAWSPQLQLSAGRVQGIEEAVTASRTEMCAVCGQVGATVGCLGRGCRLGFHVPCAVEAGCHMDEENFTAHCSRHKRPD